MTRQDRTRRYHSPLREERALNTRRVILDAARKLLVELGYGQMTMNAVAREAGVALDTVYESVGRKPVLVRLLVETAISGEDEAVPAAERDYVHRIRGAPTAREKIAVYSDALRQILPRLAPIVVALRDAASAHPDLVALWKEIAERRAANMRLLADDLIATGELRPELDREAVADVIWSMNAPEFYTLLVGERGWSPDRFAAWLAEAWERLLLAE
ncbi:MAG: TetR/AcrR family transcriptional regulator [Actinomycetota bacterium]|nr:TetR/AcrR family transcriptional regulator [Actinomycetota bacterium]